MSSIKPGTKVVINAAGQQASTNPYSGKVYALAGSITTVLSPVERESDYYILEGLDGWYHVGEFDVVSEETDNTIASHALSGLTPTQDDLDRVQKVAAGSISFDDAMAEALKTPSDPEEEFRHLYLHDAAFHAGVKFLRARMKHALQVMVKNSSIDYYEYDRQVELLDRLGELP